MDVGAKGVSQQPGVGVHQRPSQALVSLLPGAWRLSALFLTRAATTANHHL
jgi:hypothetical protein